MAESDNQVTVIAADTHIRGEMSFERTARLFGKFDGKVTSKGELQVAEGAACNAEVAAVKVTVDGVVEGNVSAQDCVQLNNKAKIKGDIKASKLIVAEGASLFGHCAVGPDAAKQAAVQAQTKQPEAKQPEIKTVVQDPPKPKPADQQRK